MRTFLLSFLLLLACVPLLAQVSKDATVPMTATLGTNSITLNWVNPGNATLLVLRRTKGQSGTQWIQLLNVTASNLTTLTDNSGIAQGSTYEYVIQRVVGGINAFGYAHVAANAAATDNRGKVLLYVDNDLSAPLATELARLRDDLRGDGWQVISRSVAASSTAQQVKAQVTSDYNADPSNVKALFLLGSIAIPYSGNSAWDGHGEHQGAWPSDAFYADINGNWTDATVNNTTPARNANDNIPGDGKYDQSIIPTAVELQVGRVDFRRLIPGDFGVGTVTELYRRYLDKNHAWRSGAYTVSEKALVDDNFGYFGGEAFAANGFRNAYPLVGEGNIVETDFFQNTNPQRWLLGYGTGPGTYTSAGDVGSSTNFMTDTVHIVFSNLFGSYHGDWDFETNPFMPSALASQGGILTCAWAGRPHWFHQALASGETIGYCTRETQNANTNNGFFGSSGESGAHVALLGDPTLRASVVAPPDLSAGNLTLEQKCSQVTLNWPTSPTAGIAGYHVYRSLAADGAYTRVSAAPVTGTTFTDTNVATDTIYYQVRALKSVSTPGGGTYLNNSTGVVGSILMAGGSTPPQVNASTNPITCFTPGAVLAATSSSNISTWAWAGPNNYMSAQQSPTVFVPGTYTVTATDPQGCVATVTATVSVNQTQPTAAITGANVLTCAQTSTTLSITNPTLDLLPDQCVWGPPINGTGLQQTVTQPGQYFVTITATNGCTNVLSAVVTLDNTAPTVSITGLPPITCAQPCVPLPAPTVSPNTAYAWTGPCIVISPVDVQPCVNCPGVYTLVATNTITGCTSTATATIAQDITVPQVSVSVQQNPTIDCQPTATLSASTDIANPLFSWAGPGITPQTQNLPNPSVTAEGNYTVTVRNTANGCTSTSAVNVDLMSPPTLDVTIMPDFTGCSTILLTATAIGGTPPYSYLWTNGATTQTVELSGDLLTVTVTDQAGCTATGAPIIVDPPIFSAMATVKDASSPTTADGAISLFVFGGTPPYTYLWSNGATTKDIMNLLPGGYMCTITDANGCFTLITVIVGSSVATQEADIFTSLILAPNPALEQTTLRYASNRNLPMALRLFAQDGRLLWQQDVPVAVAGSVTVPTAGLPTGLYRLEIGTPEGVVSRLLAVQR
jgi:hypothetical protein